MDSVTTMGPVAAPPFRWVATAPGFDAMLAVLNGTARLAIDIEADSLYHYFEKVCLIQISTDTDTFVLDPLAVRDLQALGPILSNPAVEKVFHAASYDVFCLHRDYGFSFSHVFDTHIAAQLLGYEQLGLSYLMERLLGIMHSKRRQRDDWSRRPLEPEQLIYAAMDTHHLLHLRDLLETELQERKRLSWALEEFQAISSVEELQEREFDPQGFRKIKGNRNLTLQEQAALRALYRLRDQFARQLDVPPFKVMNNSVLLDLVQSPPRSARDLFHRPGISRRVARKFASDIHRTIEQARAEGPSSLELPARNHWKPPAVTERVRLENLKRWRQEKAKELGLHVGVVFPGSFLEMLASYPPPDLPALEKVAGIRQWRCAEFGREILELLQNVRAGEDGSGTPEQHESVSGGDP
jgi:ribonuclease D